MNNANDMCKDAKSQANKDDSHEGPGKEQLITCPTCERPFKPTKGHRKFCSKACYLEWWKVHVREKAQMASERKLIVGSLPEQNQEATGVCSVCNSPFVILDKRNRVCSDECLTKWQKKRAKQTQRKRIRRKDGTVIDFPVNADEPDDFDWAQRANLWISATPPAPLKASKKAPPRGEPIVLAGHGIRIRTERGALVIHNGFTHYPQQSETWRIYPHDKPLPSRIIVCDADGAVSFDVLNWCQRNAIPLIWVDYKGEVVSVSGEPGIDRDPKVRLAQFQMHGTEQMLKVATDLIRKKVLSSLTTLYVGVGEVAAKLAEPVLLQVNTTLYESPPNSVEDLMLLEGQAASAYFRAWRNMPLRWKGTGRHPIPDDWHRIGSRGSSLSANNRRATHPVNALLNYAYGVLEGQVRRAIVINGLDPAIGILHAIQSGRASLVYDLMEPLRPLVDRQVLRFVAENNFNPKDFILSEDGQCKLHPELARMAVRLTVTDEEVQKVVGEMVRWLVKESAYVRVW